MPELPGFFIISIICSFISIGSGIYTLGEINSGIIPDHLIIGTFIVSTILGLKAFKVYFMIVTQNF